jgi:tetratricopeptide (TPR) repeat protein
MIFIVISVVNLENKLISTVILITLFLINRKQKKNYEDFTNGKSLLEKGKYEESIELFGKFLLDMEKRPNLKKTTVFGFGFYTKSYEAMTYNNLGSAYLNLVKLDKAQTYLNKAIEIDSEYGIPYVNLALLSRLDKNFTMMKEYAEKAKELGVNLNLE